MNITKILLLTILVFSNVFLEFLIKNLKQLDYVIFIDVAKIFIFTCSITFIFIAFFIIFKKKKFYNYSLSLIFFIYVNFYFSNIKNYMKNFSNNLDGEIAFVFILLLTFIFVKLINFKNFKFIFYNFFIILFIYNSSIISIHYIKNDKIDFKNLPKNKFFNDEEVSLIKKINNKNNIYFIIMDSMMSLKTFDKKFQSNISKESLINLNKRGIKYIENSQSIYSTSYLTLSALLNMDIIVDENSKQYQNRYEFYPNMLKPNMTTPVLINELNRIGYQFKLLGPHSCNCQYNKNYCISFNNKKNKIDKKIYYEENPNNIEVNEIFFNSTLLSSVYYKFSSIVFKKNIPLITYYKKAHKNYDIISKFIKLNKIETKNSIPTFYLIHHWSPHWPYVFNTDCSLRFENEADNIVNYDGYQSAYKCALKKINKFLDYINERDANAVVVIQGNHGMIDFKKNDYADLEMTFSIFNAIKINKTCQEKLKLVKGNINSLRLILSCPFGIKNKLIKEKNYVAFYERQKDYGKIIPLEKYKKIKKK